MPERGLGGQRHLKVAVGAETVIDMEIGDSGGGGGGDDGGSGEVGVNESYRWAHKGSWAQEGLSRHLRAHEGLYRKIFTSAHTTVKHIERCHTETDSRRVKVHGELN